MESIVPLIVVIAVIIFLSGIRIVRPTHRGLIEHLGKYCRFAKPGFHWVIPIIEKMYKVNITEVMVDAEPQEIITNDNLNARVDAQVYFKVKDDEEDVKNSQYNVFNYQWQIVNLARTTLRNIIGTLTLKSANSERGKINEELHNTLKKETTNWGIDIVRTELKEIDPPQDVQETMNKVVKAENEKIAAIDFATAQETMADGARRAEIKRRTASSRPGSSKPRAKRRPSSWSTRLLINILSGTLSCSRGWRLWRERWRTTPKSSSRPMSSSSM
jgi:regulator of protease activity HflC (stomatin/prohibitin superfamily)